MDNANLMQQTHPWWGMGAGSWVKTSLLAYGPKESNHVTKTLVDVTADTATVNNAHVTSAYEYAMEMPIPFSTARAEQQVPCLAHAIPRGVRGLIARVWERWGGGRWSVLDSSDTTCQDASC